MKKTRFFGILLSILAAIMMIAGLCACDDGTKNLDDETPQATYELTLSSTLSYTLHVGDEVDFTAYFVIKDQNGTPIPVTGDMLDLSKVDLTAPGSFVVVLTYGGKSVSATFTVEAKQEEGPGTTTPDPDKDPEPDDTEKTPAETLQDVLKVYDNRSSWNFSITKTETYDGESEEDYYEYLGYNVLNHYTAYDYDDDLNLIEIEYTDYLVYDANTGKYSYYSDMADGTYEIYAENTEDYNELVSSMRFVDFEALKSAVLSYANGKYSAQNASSVATAVLGAYSYTNWYGETLTEEWISFDLYLTNGRIGKIVATTDEDTTVEYVFSKYGTVNFTLPDVGTTPEPDDPDTPVEPDPDTPDDPAQALEDALQVFEDNARWNFAVTVAEVYEGDTDEYVYRYLGYNVYNPDEEYGDVYWSYDPSSDATYYYEQDYDGVYQKYDETSDEFIEAYTYAYLIYPDYLMAEDFTFDGTKYVATDPEGVGDTVLGDYGDETDGDSWSNVYLYVSNGRVTKIEGIFGSGDKLTYVFSDYGNVNFTLPDGSSTTPDTPTSQFNPLTSPVAGEYYMGMLTQDGEYHYITGNMADPPAQYYMATTTSISGAIKVTLAGDTTNGWTIQDAIGKYIEIQLVNSHINAVYSATSTMKWTWDTAEELFIWVNGSDKYFLGTHGNLTTVGGVNYAQYIDTNYRLLLGTYGTQTPETPDVPDVPDTPDTPTDEAKIDEVLKTLTDRKIYASTVLQSELDGVALTWSSDTKMSNGISFGGNRISVTANPAKDTPIVFTVTAKLNDTTKTKTVTITVSAFDSRTLQDRDLAEREFIGLPSTGDRRVLVIPVQFKDDTAITTAQLGDLEKALNGSEADTGWESVKTYYQQASYDKLHLSIDIQTTYVTKNNASYYERLTLNDRYSVAGSETLLLEALASYEKTLDLTVYDTNKDGRIDSVYLIYSHAVDYSGKSDFYWAYTTYTESTTKFDGLYAGYYFFAGFEFMDENTANDTDPRDETIDGLKINASTYIHETGHLLGLDDYYDSTDDRGCGQGLGGADMMDYTVGDQNVYTKTVLGWLTPTIVTETTTITLSPSATTSENAAVLIPIKFNNSYFCEYLMVDLYAATGLNEMHANMNDTYLYDGEQYGVRIYHVSASITDPYNTGYSITDYNNSTTDIPLIKLVEADGGDSTFSRSSGLATANDLWKAGQKLSTVFTSYKGNDGKKVNFDIEILSVSATEAQITITFNN